MAVADELSGAYHSSMGLVQCLQQRQRKVTVGCGACVSVAGSVHLLPMQRAGAAYYTLTSLGLGC